MEGTDRRGSDTELASSVREALESSLLIPASVTARVVDGSVELMGQADWHFERDAAERTVRNLAGVMSVLNHIQLRHEGSTGAPEAQGASA